MPNGKLATPRQVAYIERLSAESETTIEKPLEELTVQEASELIDELLQKANNGNKNGTKRTESWSNGARIGLAFKVCYQRWIGSGTNIFKNRDRFIENVLETYELLNEIAQKAEAV
jgi:hypothetical protein